MLLGSRPRASGTPISRALLNWGSPGTGRCRCDRAERIYAQASARTDRQRSRSSPQRPAKRVVRVDRLLIERVVAPACRASGREGQKLGEVRSTPGASWSRVVAARRVARDRAAGIPRPVGWYAKRTAAPHLGGLVLVIVTVTLNAAIDRTLTVPNFQLGQRHRASAALTRAGGKGINVARALKRLGVPVVATGLAGGRTGTRIVEELTSEAILNDFVRIDGESRTSTAVVDPTSNTYTEINEWGPEVDAGASSQILREKLAYLARGAEFVVLRRHRCRAASTTTSTASSIRELNRAQRARPCSTPRASRCGSASRPSRSSSRRTSARPRRSSGTSSSTTAGPRRGARRDRRPRRAQRPDHARERAATRSSARSRSRARSAPTRRASRPSPSVGAGDVLLAGFLAARVRGRAVRGGAARRRRGRRRVDARGRAPAASTRARPRGLAAGRPASSEPRARARRGLGRRLQRGDRSASALVRPGSHTESRRSWRQVEIERLLAPGAASSPRKGSPSTTSCSSRPSRRCCRTRSRRARASRADRARRSRSSPPRWTRSPRRAWRSRSRARAASGSSTATSRSRSRSPRSTRSSAPSRA